MKSKIVVSKNLLQLKMPINIRQKYADTIDYNLITISENNQVFNYSLSSIPGLHSIYLNDKTEEILKILYSVTSMDQINISNYNLHPEVMFSLESLLLNYEFEKNEFPYLDVSYNYLYETNNYYTADYFGTLKFKLNDSLCQDVEFIAKVNYFILSEEIEFIRFDGNKNLTKSCLEEFLNDLISLKKIEYIEEPFIDFEESIKFGKTNQLKIAIDESLSDYLENLEQLSDTQFAILRPTLLGFAKTKYLIDQLNKKQIKVIISSSFDLANDFLCNIVLSDYSNLVSNCDNYHGLDTLKYLPQINSHISLTKNKITLS